MDKGCDPRKDYNFFSNACQVCRAFGKDVLIRRCLRCQIMPYCSRKHQKEHWPEHKDYCYVLRKVVAAVDPGYGNHKNEKYPKWTKTRLSMLAVLQRELRRPLTFYDVETMLFPRSCEICRETDPRKLIDCPDCPDASFCIEHPRDDRHSAKCKISQIHFETNTMDIDLIDSVWQPATNFGANYGKRPPKNMDEALRLFAPQCPVGVKGVAALTSAFLSRPYTFLFSLEQLSCPKLSTTTIHIMVHNPEDVIFNDFWHLLLHHNLPFKVFRIVLVGPNLTNQSEEVKLCVKCEERNCKIFIQSVASTYEIYIERPLILKPHYVIAFNISIPSDDSLLPSLKAVEELDCPFILTTFIDRHLKNNEEKLNSYFDGTIEPIWNGRNPFSSLKPHREMDDCRFYFHNQFLTIYDTLA